MSARRSPLRRLRGLVLRGAALVFLFFAASGVSLVYHEAAARRDGALPGPAAAILVLGGDMGYDGAPGPSTARRVQLGAALWHAGAAPKILFSGGRGGRRQRSAAEGMAEYAERLGVPPQAMLLETESRSTLQNALMSRPILDARAPGPVIVVTEAYHMGRSILSLRLAGIEIGGFRSVPTALEHPRATLYALLREGAAAGFNVLRAAVWLALDAAGVPERKTMPLLVQAPPPRRA